MEKRPALGKGLSALIPDVPEPAPRVSGGVLEIDIDRLAPNDYQPRVQMDDAALDELAASIKANGIIQPILVRQAGDGYRIIAGERRWRAARKAGLARVPVNVRDTASDAPEKLLELALIENIQREDLNPIDEARAYKRLADEFRLTQEAMAVAVGKDRATIANTLRLLRLPEEIQNDLVAGALSMGHARALLALPTDLVQLQVAREVKTRGLSVRETEALVKAALEGHPVGGPASRRTTTATPPDVHTRAAEEKLKIQLGTRVRIVRKGKGGRIEIDFTSEEELIRIYETLTER
jgi:ParB family transcriptional regulator, chromosome partitioning protein